MTSLLEEREAQRAWRLRAEFAGIDLFDRLVENEFAAPEQGEAEQGSALRAIVQFAAARVPYYRERFARLGIDAVDIRSRRDLARLPVLTRHDLRDNYPALQPEQLPAGTRIWGVTQSSGSTGPPTRVVMSADSNFMFTVLNQRQSRWFRRDPAGVLAWIRSPDSLPRPERGRHVADGQTLRRSRWPYVGTVFETGPSVYYSVTNPLEEQIAWLRRERPDYLLMRAHALEHLAITVGCERPCDSLRAVTAISEALSVPARRRLALALGAAVQQGYGLNEIGLVAVRCEAGRYHVHREHCVVEIVDEAGVPCAAGQAGRLLVTGLQNFAMPLIRYDTDDLATATTGPCACGRTLPSFGDIHGRASHLAPLPPGTLARAELLRAVVWRLLDGPARGLRRYQIRQSPSGDFELQVDAASPLPDAFRARVMRAWDEEGGADRPGLAVRQVSDIPCYTHGDKFADFVSAFAAAPR